MNVNIENRAIPEIEADALVMLGFDGSAPTGTPAGDQVKELYESREFSGKALEIAVLHRPAGIKAKRLVLAGAGKQERFNAAELRKLAGAAVRTLKSKGVRTIVLALGEPYNGPDFGAAAVEGALLADTEADRYKTDPKKNEKAIDSFAVTGISGAALDRGRILAEAQNFTRALANEPPNILTPLRLAESARQMAAE